MKKKKLSVDAEQDARKVLALQESEEPYRITIENILDPVFITDSEGKFTFVSPSVPHILGYSVEEIQAMGNISACVGEGRSLFDLEDLNRQGEISNIEAVVANKNGSKRDYLITVKRVSIKGGTILYVCRDITERKQAEEERKAHIRFLESLERIDQAIKQETDVEQMLRHILETVFSIFDCDRTWLFYPCDPDAPSFRVPMEIYRPEYPGAKVLNVDVPMSPDLAQNLREALESDDPVTYTAGTERPINKVTAEQFGVQSQMFVAIYPKLGKPWVFGMHQCSYPRIWTEEEQKLFKEIGRRISDGLSSVLFLRELQENEERFRATFEQAAVGIAHVAPDGRWLRVNRKLCDIVGYSREELLQKKFQDITHPEDLDADLEYVRRVLAGEIPTYSMEKRYIRKDGSPIWINLTVSIVHHASGEPVYFISVIEDITKRKRAEEEIQRLNSVLEQRVVERTAQLEATVKELEAFSYSVSHDLRAPLRGIDGWSLALLEDCTDRLNEQGQKYLGNVRMEAQRMGRIIDDLLKLSRVTRIGIKRKDVDLSAQAQSIAARFQDTDPERQVEFIIQPRLTIYGDARLTEVMLTNLLDNAWKFTSKHPSARIEFGRTEMEGQTVYFVRDDGVGFDMTYAKNLFGAFQRMHQASQFPGSGIGLATVQRIVNRHGGRIWAEGEVEKGATVYFTL